MMNWKTKPCVPSAANLPLLLSPVYSFPFSFRKMAIRMPRIIHAKQILRRSSSSKSNQEASSAAIDVPKGYLAVYVGEGEKK
ncbi:hypothetical protein LOK49_LG03G03700 [Camellia lanceoleosa]|uniref:Uncharacterized protein n=1 Tax=Camellia lanceoleosa TaxID=1840588 RepID=A0ACC0I7X0_9ERIC|nr:hypothetical protein LOK49_LG03G03700 [Camellia lanceoleosa]